MPSHFGTMKNGIVDYHWNQAAGSDYFGPAYTYDPSYLNPFYYPADFDGCPTQSEEDAGSNTANTYTWTIWLTDDITSVKGPQHDCHLGQTQFPGFRTQGQHRVTLDVRDPSGALIPADHGDQVVTIRDLLIVALGDSYASGEGNPDVPETYAPVDTAGDLAIISPARWEDTRCHRSAAAAPSQAALALENADPHTSVTFISFACSGATINTDDYDDANPLDPYAPVPHSTQPAGSGVLGPYDGAEHADGDYATPLPSQIDQLKTALGMTDGGTQSRPIDALMLSAGGNDIGFGPIASLCVLYADCKNAQVTNVSDSGPETLAARFSESAAAMPAKYERARRRPHPVRRRQDLHHRISRPDQGR